jgi:hypothetical protein
MKINYFFYSLLFFKLSMLQASDPSLAASGSSADFFGLLRSTYGNTYTPAEAVAKYAELISVGLNYAANPELDVAKKKWALDYTKLLLDLEKCWLELGFDIKKIDGIKVKLLSVDPALNIMLSKMPS